MPFTIVGTEDDIDSVVSGVAIGARPNAALRHQMRNARELDPHAVAAIQQALNNRRRKILPAISNPSIAANQIGSLVFRTQEPYRPERLVFSGVTVANFTVLNIMVGTKMQLAAEGIVPAEIFQANAFDCDLHFDTANVGNDVNVRLQNNDGAAAHVPVAAFLGTSLS